LDTANVTAADSSSLNQRWIVLFFTQGSRPGWQSKMGAARVECVSGCTCTAMMIGGKASAAAQLGISLGYARMQVSGLSFL
jgi:hypothetical protein